MTIARPLPSALLIGLILTGCAAREHLNSDCQWTHDDARPLDLRRPADEQHLITDASVAEELAIRYADTRRGHRSGHFAGMAEYTRTRERCLGRLFETIADTHGVNVAEVREHVGRRPAGLDPTVLGVFATLYAVVCVGIAGTVLRRFPVDALLPALTATAVMSVIAAASGLMAFALWAATIEMVRVGNTHMSYRVGRMPWTHHGLQLFAGGVAVFWGVALVRFRTAQRSNGLG